MSYTKELETAISVAREAGAVIREAFTNRGKAATVDYKKENAADLVTVTDRAVEALVFSKLRAVFPDHKFIGEETVSATEDAKTQLTDAPTWVVDPVDGTTNFVHGFPFVAVAIGFVIEKVPVVGVVYNPILDELFHASAGQGAFLNNQPLPLMPPTPLPSLATALVATEYGSDRQDAILGPKFRALQKVVADPVRGVRSLGSAALNMCYVARGALDAYWEAGVHLWDVAAATIVVREAGGAVVNWKKPESSGTDVTKEVYDGLAREVVCVRATKNGVEEIAGIISTIREYLEAVSYPRD
ncbi:Inositol monophosphatase 2 [Rhizophlyctis rosea]|uniref:Inositol-1-monophosphatase n=1 Tax=Rhizophlyctis rosea TaxID=64517 RepID=A0AAD5X6U9_9FUNG|nr:Inositol monophosphatase 2 [Rhizophlyctis rosea]